MESTPFDAPVSSESAPATTVGSENVDGRTLRRTRNRTAVIVALLDMLREGDLDPSASDIAERAGVSHRSIFRYFDDLDDLVRTTIDYAIARAFEIGAVTDVGQGTFATRVDNYVDARLRVFSDMDGPLRVARMRAYSIPSIDAEFARAIRATKDLIRVHFAPELSIRSPHDQELLIDNVLVATAYDAYAMHIRMIENDHERYRAATVAAVWALLGPGDPVPN